MRDDDAPTVSADQDAWVDLARAVRAQLFKAAEMLPAMKPDEQQQFVLACKEALWLNQNAADFDHYLELQAARVTHAD